MAVDMDGVGRACTRDKGIRLMTKLYYKRVMLVREDEMSDSLVRINCVSC